MLLLSGWAERWSELCPVSKSRHSKNGKESRNNYNRSKKGKETKAAYKRSEKGKAGNAAYYRSEKGQKSHAIYNSSPKAKETQAAYYRSEKGTEKRITATAKRYGLTVEQHQELKDRFEGRCWICLRKPATILHTDHDHACCPEPGRSCGNCVRGMLCAGNGGCNSVLLGKICQESAEGTEHAIMVLERAIAYLRGEL